MSECVPIALKSEVLDNLSGFSWSVPSGNLLLEAKTELPHPCGVSLQIYRRQDQMEQDISYFFSFQSTYSGLRKIIKGYLNKKVGYVQLHVYVIDKDKYLEKLNTRTGSVLFEKKKKSAN